MDPVPLGQKNPVGLREVALEVVVELLIGRGRAPLAHVEHNVALVAAQGARGHRIAVGGPAQEQRSVRMQWDLAGPAELHLEEDLPRAEVKFVGQGRRRRDVIGDDVGAGLRERTCPVARSRSDLDEGAVPGDGLDRFLRGHRPRVPAAHLLAHRQGGHELLDGRQQFTEHCPFSRLKRAIGVGQEPRAEQRISVPRHRSPCPLSEPRLDD
jgi:hypothetical protein